MERCRERLETHLRLIASFSLIQSPMWSQLGLQNGSMPTDIHTAGPALGATVSQFDRVYEAYQTGGPGADTTVVSSFSSYAQYPPHQQY
ncbi:hypothetical protein EDB19DRAFT_1693560 [Suillus lakei]|nr:hypothetical protein EDB19DRAFT_1693560 [Suillus lakei]